MSTYSFMDVTATLTGPTGSIDLGYGSASSEEGIVVAMGGPKNTMTIGADGEVMPGLFVGGEASCNSAYMGFTLSNCFTWGRIGAQSAAAYLKA